MNDDVPVGFTATETWIRRQQRFNEDAAAGLDAIVVVSAGQFRRIRLEQLGMLDNPYRVRPMPNWLWFGLYVAGMIGVMVVAMWVMA